jgi:hypothetical protein
MDVLACDGKCLDGFYAGFERVAISVLASFKSSIDFLTRQPSQLKNFTLAKSRREGPLARG